MRYTNIPRDLGIGVREYPAYRLTRDGFAFLAMGFTGKKAAAWKERFLEAFNCHGSRPSQTAAPKEAERLERQRQKELTEQKNLEQQEQPAPDLGRSLKNSDPHESSPGTRQKL